MCKFENVQQVMSSKLFEKSDRQVTFVFKRDTLKEYFEPSWFNWMLPLEEDVLIKGGQMAHRFERRFSLGTIIYHFLMSSCRKISQYFI